MSLGTQILLVIVSFFFGVLFELIHSLCYKIIYCKKIVIKVFFTFLLKINNGIIHIYGIISLLVGILSFYYLKLLFYKKYKK